MKKKSSKKIKKYPYGGDYENNDLEKGNAISDGIYNTGTGVVGSFNPLLGSAMGAAGKIGGNARKYAERTDSQGNLVNKDIATTGHIVGTFANPMKSLTNVLTNKNASKGQKVAAGLTGGLSEIGFNKPYLNQVEAAAKANLPQSEEDPTNYRYNNVGDIQAQYMAMGGKMREMRVSNGYAGGGIIPNAELEKQETIRMPDGSTDQVDGPSHENGGVKMSLLPGTQVFSDRLKASTGKTFAKEAKKYDTTKFKKILEDDKKDALAKKTAELMFKKHNESLSRLFNEQEAQKQQKALKAFNSFQKKYGGDLIPKDFNPDNVEMKKGGWVVSAINSLDLMKKGGTIPKYTDGDTIPLNLSNSTPEQDMNNYYNNIGNNSTPITYSSVGSQANQAAGNVTNSNITANNKPDWTRIGTETGLGVLNNLGSLSYLAEQGKKYDKQKYYKYNPTLLDNSATLRDIENSNYAAKKSVGQLAGGHAGLAMNALLAAKLQGDKTKAQVVQDYQNANAGISNQGQQYNIGNKYMTDDRNQANKDAAYRAYYKALQQTGENITGQVSSVSRENKQNQMDQMRLDNLSDIYNNHKYDKKTNKWVYVNK